MLSNSLKSLNFICLICYLIFMGLALDTKMVDALVFYVSDTDGKPVYVSGSVQTTPIVRAASSEKTAKLIVAIQYKRKATSNSLQELEKKIARISEAKNSKIIKGTESTQTQSSLVNINTKNFVEKTKEAAISPVVVAKLASDKEKAKEAKKQKQLGRLESKHSALSYIQAISSKKWEYASLLDRYIVQYDKDTYIVLTIRPGLQKQVENVLKKYKSRIAVGLIQDPTTGAVLAMASSHKNKILDIESNRYQKDNWALKATFPVASIFKIITSAAGLDNKKITKNSNVRAWKRSCLKVWQAFARSHNGVFGRIANMVGKSTMEKYAKAFGFNRRLFFDLPVNNSVAKFPSNKTKLGQASAGLNRNFLTSPIHVASIISTVVNGGKTMKPYLVDYVVKKNKIVFRRKPFQLGQPMKKQTARDIYEMMHATTLKGTGKKGFGGYKRCPNLAKMCGGKTGTLTGADPHYLFTWFGGYVKVTGRDLSIVTLMGQKSHSGTKASSVAGQIAYELYMSRNSGNNEIASK